MAQIVSGGYIIDRHPTKRSLFAAGVAGCPSATQQDSIRKARYSSTVGYGSIAGRLQVFWTRRESTRVVVRDYTRTHIHTCTCTRLMERTKHGVSFGAFSLVHREDG